MEISLTAPDDWHLHLRDGPAMGDVVSASAARFRRAVIMPNLKPPVTTTAQARAYRERILAALPADSPFEPLMTLYLTDNTPPEEIRRARASGIVHAVKLYPAGATTNSDAGVTNLNRVEPVLDAMARADMPLLVHGEVAGAEVDVFDRERLFLERVLAPVHERFPGLSLVLEHITTCEAVAFVRAAAGRVGATITPHHLLYNRNALFAGGLHPHLYCLPVLKRERHRQAVLAAATSGDPRFFLGTDSAPHAAAAKESSCGCAGIYTAHAAIELYAEAFEQAGSLARLEAFASFHGPDFYGLPRNTGRITLRREPWRVPETLAFGGERLIPLRAGGSVAWRLS